MTAIAVVKRICKRYRKVFPAHKKTVRMILTVGHGDIAVCPFVASPDFADDLRR